MEVQYLGPIWILLRRPSASTLLVATRNYHVHVGVLALGAPPPELRQIPPHLSSLN